MENFTIHCLPNELLFHIFSYVQELNDKLVIKKVCQHWKALILAEHFEMDSLTAIPIRTNTLGSFGKMLKVNGKHLKSIAVAVGATLETELGLVVQNCPNLKTLDLQFLPQSRFVMRRNSQVLSTILSHMPTVRALHIGWPNGRQRFNFDWRSIHVLPQPISQLSVCGNSNTLPYACSLDLSCFPDLLMLQVGFFSLSDQTGPNLRNSLNITDLAIHKCVCEDDAFLKGISYLKNLKSLTLSHLICISFDDEILRGIIENCPNINELNLIHLRPDELTDLAFENVHQLRTLQTLNVQEMNSLTGHIFEKLVKLEKLILVSNSVIDDDVISFVAEAPHLSLLDFTPNDWRQFIVQINFLIEARLKPLTLNVPEVLTTMEWLKDQELSQLLRFEWGES